MTTAQTSRIPSDYEEYIDSIRWDELNDAYGNSNKVYKVSDDDKYGTPSLPTYLKQLCSDDEGQRMDAILEGIWSRAYHQGDLYPASPYAAKALLILLRSPAIVERESRTDGPLSFEIIKYLDWCALCFRHKPTEQSFLYLSAAVKENIDTIMSYSSEPKVRDMVARLIDNINLVCRSA